jgi:hypothetical protein
MSSDISCSGLTSGTTYNVSYWTQNGSPFTIAGTISGFPIKGKTINDWTFYLHKVTGQSTISLSGSGHIDELRLYPALAQMTTFTYTPLVGLTSQCDENNRITYYEYDGFQRLKLIRDQDYNILKTYEYQYQASGGCGANCFVEPLQTMAGTNTLGYPVGVFNVNGKLLGNATSQSAYVTIWNLDTDNSAVGILAAGADPLHFQITLNTGKTLPAITGCRYYQMDLAWNQLDGIRNVNGVYVDFGDGTSMPLGKNPTDVPPVVAPNTNPYFYTAGTHQIYYIHTYRDTSLKTLTLYHNDAVEDEDFDNGTYPANGLIRLKNLRGNIPQYTTTFGGSCYQQPSMTSVAGIANWNSINTIQYFRLNNGDKINPSMNVSYAQDFMKNNKGLINVYTTLGYYRNGYRDLTFKISRLKSDWNTYFTNLQSLTINEEHWNHEDLSALTKLNTVVIVATTQDHQDDPASPLVPLGSPEIDSIIIQIAAGAGQTVSNGLLYLYAGGGVRTHASDTAVAWLNSKNWGVYINVTKQ